MHKLILATIISVFTLLNAKAELTTPIFDWTPRTTPTGWFTTWGNAKNPGWGTGEEGDNYFFFATPTGIITKAATRHDSSNNSDKWQPWNDTVTMPTNYTLILYANADLVRAESGKLAVLFCAGKGQKHMLVKDENGNVKYVFINNKDTTSVAQEINLGTCLGTHLFTMSFNTTSGATMQIDNGYVFSNANFNTQAAAGGIQIGAVLGEENKQLCHSSKGFVLERLIVYDTNELTEDDYAAVYEACPANPLQGESLELDGRLVQQRGPLTIQPGFTVTASAVEFGDSDKEVSPWKSTFGLDLYGTLNVVTSNFTSNAAVDLWNSCNDGQGITFSEWKGVGTYNIVGTDALLLASNAVLLTSYDATSTINVDGGTLQVKGIAAKKSGNTTINLTGNGTIDYGIFPSAANGITIAKNYGYGTIVATPDYTITSTPNLTDAEANTRVDTDAITLTDPVNGTTFAPTYARMVFNGAITGTGKLNINGFVPGEEEEGMVGEVVLKNYQAGDITVMGGVLSAEPTAIASGDITVKSGATLNILVDENESLTSNQEIFRNVYAEEGAKFTINGQSTYITFSLVLADGKLRVIGDQTASTTPVLRISEIMPKPSDLPVAQLGTLEGFDVNGLESGWVELENTSDQWANLADYRFIRINRGKKTDVKGNGNFPERWVAPHSRTIFYTSERYSNSKDKSVSAFATGTFDGKPQIFPELNNVLVWGDKVNPKKSPFVRLYFAPEGQDPQVVDTVVIPTDLPEGHSVIVGNATDEEGTRRWICPTPTRGTANTSTENLVRVGPTVGPLYEISTLKKTDVANEFERNAPPAIPGEDYNVTLAVNAVMNPDGTFSPRAADAITRIRLVYRKDLDNATLTTNEVDLTTINVDTKAWGDQYTATIPSAYFPAAGHLIQWKALITDAEETVWTAPAFNNKDDGYEWYGTIVEPGSLNSSSLPTWHMFADSASLSQMDIDVVDQTLENNARVAIYDASTSNYYDYVRIDMRGHTSGKFTKKSHSLRFAKAHPISMTDSITGEKIDGLRKTSLISEFADPSRMRQMMAFWLMRKMGNKVPFDFPVRCNLNGEFYQLAFHSERFTDELLEDYYNLDKFGYGYKNVGTLASGSSTTSGGIEKKTPDDGNETDLSVLENELRSKLSSLGAGGALNFNNKRLTKFVVSKFNLPAWINYLASTKVTGENDDVWGNLCVYYDNAQMTEGVRGTDTWMPLAYDMNLSFGQWYVNDVASGYRSGYMTTNDWHKSHPLYGGSTIRCWNQPMEPEIGSTVNGGNLAFEAVWQSDKFRRLYLRRLRTLMDRELKAPGVAEAEVPFMVEMRRIANLIREDAVLDLAKWPNNSTDDAIDIWKNSKSLTRPTTIDDAITEIWNEYVVPRREHLYVTHSITNPVNLYLSEAGAGYGIFQNAGIPTSQSPIVTLKNGFTATYKLHNTRDGLGQGIVVIENNNNEVVDMSGWELTGPVSMTLPEGTVIDSKQGDEPGKIIVTANRRKVVDYLNWMEDVEDQIIIGDGKDGAVDSEILLTSASGEKVIISSIEIAPGESVELSSANEEELASELAKCEIVLSSEDIEAGMTVEMLKVVAEPVKAEGEQVIGYRASVAINSDVVDAPLFARKEEEQIDPIVVVNGDSATECSLTIRNAVRGLWYGCEVTDDLKKAFRLDVNSFKRATEEITTIEPTPLNSPRGFFRVKVLPFCPPL